MDTLPLRQIEKCDSQSQRPPFYKAGQSQTTIDLYLRPIAKAKQDQNDIRKYFLPVVKTKVTSDDDFSQSSAPAKMPATPKSSHDDNGSAKCQTPARSPSLKSPAECTMTVTEGRQSSKRAPGNFVRASNHNHAKSAVLPRFDPFFDHEFPHSTSPMAPRVTDIVRHSLVPKPLNVKMPTLTAETSRSPSQTTSSPSSAGDPDTASLDGERREAPSFKQTYLSVHSRQNTNDSPVSPLMALRDPSPRPLRRRIDRPATLRFNTVPTLSKPTFTDSVIYFLPQISPTSESSADEREPLIRTGYSKPVEKTSIRDVFRAKRQAVKLENGISAQIDRRKIVPKERAVTVSPGM